MWDYPRPPRLERTPRRIRSVLGGITVRLDDLEAQPGVGSECEWKGAARYFNVVVEGW